MTVLTWESLELKPEEVFRAMGYGGVKKEMNATVREITENTRNKALKLIKAQCLYILVPVEVAGTNQILLDGKYKLSCVDKFFQGASQAAVGITTAGPDLEQEVTNLFNAGEALEGITLDAYGTTAVDEARGLVRREVFEKVSAEGMTIGFNVSPGGHKIPMEGQRVIFSLVNAEQIGVRLTASFLMSPVKSSSFIIPVGKNLAMPFESFCTTCDYCSGRATCQNSRYR